MALMQVSFCTGHVRFIQGNALLRDKEQKKPRILLRGFFLTVYMGRCTQKQQITALHLKTPEGQNKAVSGREVEHQR
ncbi:hypothetical protein DOE73_09205 [Paenibacillus dendritiformis]|nr:hypothetical protein DOE73_09205 [Paenibacillus dendritiformis]